MVLSGLEQMLFLGGSASAPLVMDIGFCLIVAGLLCAIFVKLKIPEIAAFLVGGVLIGPVGLNMIKQRENVPIIAELGLILLLFVIGLEINLKKLLASGKTLILSGLLQFPLCIAFGSAVGYTLQATGWEIMQGTYMPLYIGLTAAASSTLLVSKLLQQKFQMDTVVGRVSIGILIFQDIWAIIVLAIQPSLPKVGQAAAETGSTTSIGGGGHVASADPATGLLLAGEGGPGGMVTIALTFLSIFIVLGVAIAVAKYVLPYFFKWIAKLPELMLVVALGWCFGVGAFGEHLEPIFALLGWKDSHLMVGMSMGALIAGAAIASMPYAHEVVTKVEVVKNFFVTLFFVALGMQIPKPDGMDVIILAFALAAVSVIARYFVFFPLMYYTGMDRRNSFVASTKLAQVSEFCLVIAYLGYSAGHFKDLDNEMTMVSSVIFSFVITALITPTLFNAGDAMHDKLAPLLQKLGFKAPPSKAAEEGGGHDPGVVLLGFHRVASSILHEIQHQRPDMIHEVLVVDFNVALHEKIKATGAHVHYGDISNHDVLHHLGVNRAKVIVCTIPDDVLKGTSNLKLTKMLRHLNHDGKIFVTALTAADAVAMYEAGADFVMMPRIDAAKAVLPALDAALGGELDAYVEEHGMGPEPLGKRSEVLA